MHYIYYTCVCVKFYYFNHKQINIFMSYLEKELKCYL